MYIEQWGCCSHLAAVWHRCFLRESTRHRPRDKTGCQPGFLKYRASLGISHTGPFTSALHLKQLLQRIAISKNPLVSLLRWPCYWNFKRLPITSSPQRKKTPVCRNFENTPDFKRALMKKGVGWFLSVVPGGEFGSLGDYKPSETEVSLCVRLGRRPLSFPSLLRRRTPRLVLLGRYETRPL